jgi:hypothetical protein
MCKDNMACPVMTPEEGDVRKGLQAKIESKAVEAESVRSEIEKAKLEVEMLRLQLQFQGVNDESLIPSGISTGGQASNSSNSTCSDHKRMIDWLAENLDLTSTKQGFHVPEPELNVGGHRAILGATGDMLQWALNVPGGLKLSAPRETERELTDIITKAHRGLLSSEDVERFAEDWLLVTTEMAMENGLTPAFFLIHKESDKAIVVSSWPTLPEPPKATPYIGFDTAAFLSSRSWFSASTPGQMIFKSIDGSMNILCGSGEAGLLWSVSSTDQDVMCRSVEELGLRFTSNDQFTITGPFGDAVIADPAPGPMQRLLVCKLVSLALDHGVRVAQASRPHAIAKSSCLKSRAHKDRPRRKSWSCGDRVEVNYEGGWLAGVMHAVVGDAAHVRCDGDAIDVITVAPLSQVRAARSTIDDTKAKMAKIKHLSKSCGSLSSLQRREAKMKTVSESCGSLSSLA